MQFHHHGYVSTDPRVQPAAGIGIDRPVGLPDQMDVLIVGAGPAGMITAASLAQFPEIDAHIIDRRASRLVIGQADGIQARSVETFEAFGFAPQIVQEAYQITSMNFWAPDPKNNANIVRTSRALDDPGHKISEYPHMIVNQARVLDYFRESMANSPSRMGVDWGYDFVSLTRDDASEYPIEATLVYTDGEKKGEQRVVRTKYLMGADGARSKVRENIGRKLVGDQAWHAWSVMDVLAETDFPDIRTKCAIQSEAGSILHIPREGNYLFRMYVDLGVTDKHDAGKVRETTVETAIERANAILHPYTLDVKNVAWYSVYEVGHRVTDKFDDVDDDRDPRVFIAGDACHTHSAKAGQGMNVSMQDGFNLGWKLGYVLTGRAPASLLKTYSAERQEIAVDLINFDKTWSTMMAKKPEEFESPQELSDFYVKTAEFPNGFMTQYKPSIIVGTDENQELASGFPIGKRFKSCPVYRVSDTNPVHLGHHHRADGRYRVYAFADAARPGDETSALSRWAEWMASDESPVARFTPKDADIDSLFDVKVVYQQPYDTFDYSVVPEIFKPHNGPFKVMDYEKVYAADPAIDIFDERGIDREKGAVVVVRPDQYVAAVLPLDDTDALTAYFEGFLTAPAN